MVQPLEQSDMGNPISNLDDTSTPDSRDSDVTLRCPYLSCTATYDTRSELASHLRALPGHLLASESGELASDVLRAFEDQIAFCPDCCGFWPARIDELPLELTMDRHPCAQYRMQIAFITGEDWRALVSDSAWRDQSELIAELEHAVSPSFLDLKPDPNSMLVGEFRVRFPLQPRDPLISLLAMEPDEASSDPGSYTVGLAGSPNGISYYVAAN